VNEIEAGHGLFHRFRLALEDTFKGVIDLLTAKNIYVGYDKTKGKSYGKIPVPRTSLRTVAEVTRNSVKAMADMTGALLERRSDSITKRGNDGPDYPPGKLSTSENSRPAVW
jgi:hypothetical protein